jgi:predicted ArsR family transcriptional regulator
LPVLAHAGPKFDRYQDIPEQGIWDRTENYLRSLGYFALCSEFIESESLSLFQRFLSVHSPEYPFLKQRFRDLLADAARYVSISGDRTRKNIREAQSRASSGGRKTRSDKGSGRRAREIAELFAAGWTATEIARRFGVHRATVHKHLKVLKDSGGISKLYPDLQCLFAVPWARELFDLCRKHKHRLSRRGAHNVMVTVNKYARQVQQSDFLTVKRLRKALRPRGNDSIRAIEIAIKNAIAKQVVRQRPAVLALAEKLQRKGLRLIFPDSNGPRRIRFRYAMAVCLAFRIRERLRINGAPNQLIGNTEWIWQAVKDATTFGAAIEAPTNRFLNQKYPFDADGERAASVFHAREMGTAVSN